MAEKTYDQMVMKVKDYLDASPETEMTLTEAVQALDKRMHRLGIPDTYANMFMVEIAALLDRTRNGQNQA